MVYRSDKWTELDESKLTDEILMAEFLKDTRKTIYVSSDKKVTGIITLGNFRRYKLAGTPLIQTNFSFVSEAEEEQAEALLMNHNNIYSVPVLDAHCRMCCEYHKEFHAEDITYNGNILRSWAQLLPKDQDSRNLVFVKWEHPDERMLAREIMNQIDSRVVFVEEDEIADIQDFIKSCDYETIYDSVPERFRIREVIYKEYDKNYAALSICEEREFRERIFHFESIGVFEQDLTELEPFLKSFAEQSMKVIILDEKSLNWNEERGGYEYSDKMEPVPEVLIVCYLLISNVCCYYQDRVVPMISRFTYPVLCRRNISDYDVAYNVIPRLERNGVSTLVVSNVMWEIDNITGYEQTDYDDETKEKRIIRAFGIKESEKETCDAFKKEWYDRQIHSHHAYVRYRNNTGRYFNIFNGERLTVGNPKEYEHTCWIFGPCVTFGNFVDDAHALGSLLRKKLPASYYIRNIFIGFSVLNFTMRDYRFKKGDICIIYPYAHEIYQRAGIETISTVSAYSNCENLPDHIIDSDILHVDSYLTKRIADIIYEAMCRKCSKALILGDTVKNIETVASRKMEESVCFGVEYKTDIPPEMSQWLCSVKQYRGMPFEKTGSIVMNCNPFTLGHRYLIEQACIQVDKLIVFVVEENKSFFNFKDRIEMVRLGTADLKKVVVVPSGKYIISAQTLPGYFEKDDNPEVIFDATEDLDLFAKVIAAELNISVRFAGEEPIDGYTRQYNQAMSRVLPAHGITFVEIPRREYHGSVISASRVRNLMIKKDYKEIKELVMPEIYGYLEKHYF